MVAVEKVGSNATYYAYGKSLIGRLNPDNSKRYYHHDGSGNVRAMTDESGNVVERYDYEAFGTLRNTPLPPVPFRNKTGILIGGPVAQW